MNSYAENFPVTWFWTECFKEPLRPLTVPIEYFFKKQSFLLYIIYIHLKKKDFHRTLCNFVESTTHDSVACRTTLAEKNVGNYFLNGFISLSHPFRGTLPILLYIVVSVYCLFIALLRASHCISVGLRSRLWLGHCETLIAFY